MTGAEVTESVRGEQSRSHGGGRRGFAALWGFALVSGGGLLLDMVLFAVLRRSGWSAFHANVMSAGCAVTFVFFVAVYKVFFAGKNRFLLGRFLVYLAYQAFAIWLASLAVAWIAPRLPLPNADALPTVLRGAWLPGILAKIFILPATFYTNFLFMARLTTGRWRWR